MKLLIISQYFYPEQFCVSDVSFKLAEMGHDVTVLTGLPNYPTGSIYNGYQWASLPKDCFDTELGAYIENINGVKVIRCNLTPRKTGKKNLFRNYLSFLYQASKIARKMARSTKYNFDNLLVFQFSPITMVIPGIILKNKLHKSLVLYCFDLWPESIVAAGLSNHGIIYHCILHLSRWIYKRADTLLISSRSFEKYFMDKLRIHTPVTYLPIYAEDLFTRSCSEKPNENDKDTDATNLVFAGNIGAMQSMDTIIKAADLLKENSNIHFHIVGDGSYLEKSKNLAQELALNNITFHGRHPLEDMPKYYDMADAFLVTLKKDPFISYTLPGKVQSYMASGKPIIAAIDGEAYDTIQTSGCGLCCQAEDYDGLSQIILKFAYEKSNRQKYGDCSKSYYHSNFSEEYFFKTLLNILHFPQIT